MATLKSEHKRLIVMRLATWVKPTEIKQELQELGVVVSLPQIAYYDPQSKGTDLAPEWQQLHALTREQFLKDTAHIAISHRSYRLQELGDMYAKSKQGKNYPLAASLLEQAAKETGDSYTNKRELTGKDGEPLVPGASLDDLSEAELVELAQRLAGAPVAAT